MKNPILAAFTLALTLPLTAAAETRADEILTRLHDANRHRDHVMIVAHRGLWNRAGENIYPEGSLSSVQKAIGLGIEIVELDIRKSKDGEYYILHDDELARTTNCTGSSKEKTIAELKQCQLKITNHGKETLTDERIPTLAELYDTIKGNILLNLDNKIGYDEFPAMFKLAQQHGVEKQILATVNQNTPEQQQKSAQWQRDFAPYGVELVPNLYDSDVGLDMLEQVLTTYQPAIVQLRNAHKNGEPMTQDGGIYFSRKGQNLGIKYNAHYWLNTLYNAEKPGLRSGGRGDEMAVPAGLADDVFGFWIDHGVTVFQTDEPEILLDYLQEHGYRQPYRH